MKQLIDIINEKLIVSKNSGDPKKMLDTNIRDIEHLRELLTEYFKLTYDGTISVSKILKKPAKWDYYGSKRTTVYVENRFHISFTTSQGRTNHELHCGEINGEVVFQEKYKGPLTTKFSPIEMVGYNMYNFISIPVAKPYNYKYKFLDWLNGINVNNPAFGVSQLLKLFNIYKKQKASD